MLHCACFQYDAHWGSKDRKCSSVTEYLESQRYHGLTSQYRAQKTYLQKNNPSSHVWARNTLGSNNVLF